MATTLGATVTLPNQTTANQQHNTSIPAEMPPQRIAQVSPRSLTNENHKSGIGRRTLDHASPSPANSSPKLAGELNKLNIIKTSAGSMERSGKSQGGASLRSSAVDVGSPTHDTCSKRLSGGSVSSRMSGGSVMGRSEDRGGMARGSRLIKIQ